MICKKSKCTGEVKPPGRTYCEACRKKRCEALKEYLKLATETYRVRNRKNARKYAKSRTERAKAYKERHKKSRGLACQAWTARNPDRKRLIARLFAAVASGDIIKPDCCQDCGKGSGPVVAFGLEEVDGAPVVQAWVCWTHFWARKRGEV